MLTVETFDDKKGDWDEIGGEEAGDGEGDDSVESDTGANVDETDEGNGDAGKGDGAEGDRETLIYLKRSSFRTETLMDIKCLNLREPNTPKREGGDHGQRPRSGETQMRRVIITEVMIVAPTRESVELKKTSMKS